MYHYLQWVYRLYVAGIKSINLAITSLKYWPIKEWADFWFRFRGEKQIRIKNYSFTIRTKNLSEKIVDLYMITSCIDNMQYEFADAPIKEKDVVIDIGANIGAFSIYAAKKVKDEGLVVGIEPDPDNFAHFEKNIRLNSLKNVASTKSAVCGKTGITTFYNDPINNAAHSVTKKTGRSIEVNCITLEKIFQRNDIKHCDLLKIDCEGAEYEILFNTPHSIFEKIDKIVLEYHSPIFYHIDNPRYAPNNLKSLLEGNGFKVTDVKENKIQGMMWAVRDGVQKYPQFVEGLSNVPAFQGK